EVLEILLGRFDAPFYLGGESLGSGVATGLAAAPPETIRGLLLVTPFTSLAAAGRRHFPYLPARLRLRDNFANTPNLRLHDGSVAMLLAGRDRVTPAALGKLLHDSYHGPRLLRIQPEAGHNTLALAPGNPLWRELGEFL